MVNMNQHSISSKNSLQQLLYLAAVGATIFFYFAYSVVPAIYAVVSIDQDLPIYFWLKLSQEQQLNLAIFQLLGFFVLLFTLPRNIPIDRNSPIGWPKTSKTAHILLTLLCVYTIIPALEMIYRSAAVQGRNELFIVSTEIIGKYKLQPCFLVLVTLVLHQFLATFKLSYILFISPIVSIELMALGRALPFAALSLFAIIYIIRFQKIPSFKNALYVCFIFLVFSLARSTDGDGGLNILDSAIYVFGEAFNTQRSIEIAILSETSVPLYSSLFNLLAEFIPLGIKSIFLQQSILPINVIDNAKEFVYGTEISMGFGSSWVSQFVIYFGNTIIMALYPIALSVSLKILKTLQKRSFYLSCYYLYFYISGLFVFMRYGLNLSISYPLTNTFNIFVLIGLIKIADDIFFGSKKNTAMH